MNGMTSQPLLLLQQQPQQPVVALAAANQNLAVNAMLPGSSVPAAAGAAPQIMAVGGFVGAPLVGNVVGGNMLAANGMVPAWQQQQQLQQVQMGLGAASLQQQHSGLFMVPAADVSMQGWGVEALGVSHAAAVTSGHLTAGLQMAAAAACVPPVSAGELLSQQGIVLPAGVLPAVSSTTDACGNDLTGLVAATPSSCSSLSSSSNLLGALVTGQAGLPVSQAAVQLSAAGLPGMQLHGSSQLHVSDDMSQIMQQFQTMQLAVTQA
jgi:hypothetical protein